MNYATDPQFADFLLSNTQSEALNAYLDAEGIPYADLNPLYKRIWFPLDQLPENLLNAARYSAIPRLYLPQTLTALERAGILAVQNRASLQLTGTNVLLGCIDSGIQYTHPAFLTPTGDTRIAAIWDQTLTADDAPVFPGYGRVFRKTEIQRALNGAAPFRIVPSRDDTGHGTALAGIAAGSPDAGASFCGAAPQAEIAVVKVQPAKPYLLTQACLQPEAEVYAETDILSGIQWLLSLSRELELPLVICLGLQTWQGSHDGDSALEKTIDYFSGSPGLCFVTGTGNEADAQHHHSFRTDSDLQASVELLAEDAQGSFSAELWAPPLYPVQLSVRSPSGDSISGLIPRLGGQRITFFLDQTVLEINYETFRTESGNQLVYFRFLSPASGIWTIQADRMAKLTGTVHLWLAPSAVADRTVRFLQPDPFTTAMGPSTTPSLPSVSAASSSQTAVLSSSGRGYSFSGMQTPALSAPGENLLAPSYIEGYQTVSGSSTAAALTAGAAILAMEWARRQQPARGLSTTDIRTFLLRGCARPEPAQYPNPQSGYGFLDLENSFLTLLT